MAPASLVLGVTAIAGVPDNRKAQVEQLYERRLSRNAPSDSTPGGASLNRFVAGMGMAVHYLIVNDKTSFEAALHSMQAYRLAACGQMNPQERAAIRAIATDTLVRAMHVVPFISSTSARAVWDQWSAACPP